MQFYERILQRVNGALAAHFNKSMPEQTRKQMLGFVYSMKYEYQLRFDDMEVVGTELGGKVEAIMTPTGFVKKIRISPDVQELPDNQRWRIIQSAVGAGKKKGIALMEQAEEQVYGHFLRDLRPWIHGIRDNPEFFTIPEDAVETPEGIIAPAWLTPKHIHRTIPFKKWEPRKTVHENLQKTEKDWLSTAAGQKWSATVEGNRYIKSLPENRPKGAPGRIMVDPHEDKNVAYTTKRRDDMDQYHKKRALFDMWFAHPVTSSPRGRHFDAALADLCTSDLELRAAKIEWTVTRADDRAKARRDAQDAGLEPNYQNMMNGYDMKKHWHVTRRQISAWDLYDGDVLRQNKRREVVFHYKPIQEARIMLGGWGVTLLHDKNETERWNLANQPDRPPVSEKGSLESTYEVRDHWDSKLSRYPRAQAKIA
eukprot:TRINITY_DN21276_c1_g1_i1.p1 TRINITY_DN21276_c1_g1~~TRINITY_DN21276_c1_g1_i1.p1  ORF type:complete len:424 (+),score=76.51 TRINITY_DN21276_c1_g1_i1:79-1350(+)